MEAQNDLSAAAKFWDGGTERDNLKLLALVARARSKGIDVEELIDRAISRGTLAGDKNLSGLDG